MLESLALLLVCQMVGELLVQFIAWPIPGPVVGMTVLFLLLAIRRGVPEHLRQTCLTLLSHLSLLFVPAGVGVVVYFEAIAQEWGIILVALVVSTVATIAVPAFTMNRLARWLDKRHG